MKLCPIFICSIDMSLENFFNYLGSSQIYGFKKLCTQSRLKLFIAPKVNWYLKISNVGWIVCNQSEYLPGQCIRPLHPSIIRHKEDREKRRSNLHNTAYTTTLCLSVCLCVSLCNTHTHAHTGLTVLAAYTYTHAHYWLCCPHTHAHNHTYSTDRASHTHTHMHTDTQCTGSPGYTEDMAAVVPLGVTHTHTLPLYSPC